MSTTNDPAEVELTAYQRGDYDHADGSLAHYIEFHATGHHWPLILSEVGVAAALHHTGQATFPLHDVDQLARLVLAGVVRAGLEQIRTVEDATTDTLARQATGEDDDEDTVMLAEFWDSHQRRQRCALAAATLTAHTPDTRRWLPPYPLDSPGW